jgi:hypothetical protein
MNTALDCKIYFAPPANVGWMEVSSQLASVLKGTASRPSSFAALVSVAAGEFEIRKNNDFDAAKATEDIDGFLYFHGVLEFYYTPEASLADRIALIGRTLEWIWSNGWPAVAACDYEDRLPRRGADIGRR